MSEVPSVASDTSLPLSAHAATDDQPISLVWACPVGTAAPSDGRQRLLAGMDAPGACRWRVHEPPAQRPAAITYLEARLNAALLLLCADEPSLHDGQMQMAFQSLAALGAEPFVMLLDGASAQADTSAAQARILELAARYGLHQLEIVFADANGDDAAAGLNTALLRMFGLRMAHLSGPLRMQVLAEQPDASPAPTVYGNLLEGSVAAGDTVRLMPFGQIAQVRTLVGLDGRMPLCGELLTLRLAEPADVRGIDLLTAADDPVEVADEFQVRLLSDACAALTTTADWQVCLGPARRFYKAKLLDLQPLPHGEGGACGLIGRLRMNAAVPFDLSTALIPLRLFSLHADVDSPATAAGMLVQVNRAASNIHRHALSVDKAARARHKGQRPCVVWLTGLSGAGKSTIANLVEQQLLALGLHTYLLDGDNVRHGLNRDLGFSEQARAENVRRVAEVAKLMVDAGLIVITAFISPFRSERELARHLMAEGEFIEIHVDAPLAVAEQRDVKGLYRKARRGEIKGFTGIDSPYEPPENPELRIDTSLGLAEDGAAAVLRLLLARQIIPSTSSGGATREAAVA